MTIEIPSRRAWILAGLTPLLLGAHCGEPCPVVGPVMRGDVHVESDGVPMVFTISAPIDGRAILRASVSSPIDVSTCDAVDTPIAHEEGAFSLELPVSGETYLERTIEPKTCFVLTPTKPVPKIHLSGTIETKFGRSFGGGNYSPHDGWHEPCGGLRWVIHPVRIAKLVGQGRFLLIQVDEGEIFEGDHQLRSILLERTADGVRRVRMSRRKDPAFTELIEHRRVFMPSGVTANIEWARDRVCGVSNHEGSENAASKWCSDFLNKPSPSNALAGEWLDANDHFIAVAILTQSEDGARTIESQVLRDDGTSLRPPTRIRLQSSPARSFYVGRDAAVTGVDSSGRVLFSDGSFLGKDVFGVIHEISPDGHERLGCVEAVRPERMLWDPAGWVVLGGRFDSKFTATLLDFALRPVRSQELPVPATALSDPSAEIVFQADGVIQFTRPVQTGATTHSLSLSAIYRGETTLLEGTTTLSAPVSLSGVCPADLEASGPVNR